MTSPPPRVGDNLNRNELVFLDTKGADTRSRLYRKMFTVCLQCFAS